MLRSSDSEFDSLTCVVNGQQRGRDEGDTNHYHRDEFACLLNNVVAPKTIVTVNGISSQHVSQNDVNAKIQCDENTDIVQCQSELLLRVRIKNFQKKIKSDRTFRHKFLYSVFLICSFFILGWMLGQVGPCLLDLKLITDVTLEMAAFYVTSLCAGYMAGSLLSGLLYDRLNKFLLLWLFLVGLAGSVSLIPWCTHYVVMLAVQFLVGIFQGCIDTVSCAEMVSIWSKKTSQSFMQALHFGFATGGIISPLVTAPFLAPKNSNISPTIESLNSSIDLLTSPVQYQLLHSTIFKYSNLSDMIYNNSSSDFVNNETSFETEESTKLFLEYGASRVHIAFAISGAISFLVSLPFFIMFLRIPSDFNRHGGEDRKRSNKPIPLVVKVLVLINMSALSALYTGLEETFVEFLSAFCVEQVKWTKTQGSLATSLYFGSIGLGHFINIFTVRIVDHVKLMGVNCFMLILAMILITLSADNVFHVGVWIAPPFVGLSLSIIYPIIFTWTEDVFIPVTGRISSLFILTGAMGSMINPVILGVLMDDHSPMWYCYLLLIESILQFVFYLSGLALQRFVKTRFHDVNKVTKELHSNCERLKSFDC
ncbi:Sodium-dependent glucose transporter 1A [Mizuhopecten yessoensis]|uniref:Sodium-dependent glucose transporter 1A n=2 Tax=Mizuhopecten yessoensis TaxID=6573 RepID=A0A210PYM0_MIZYE|nr:Sodium-dependent glucose transporter 1A [Mizuhopecten yessoensis]